VGDALYRQYASPPLRSASRYVALWHYQQDLATYEKQLDVYQRQPAGDAPVPPVLQPQAKGKVQSIIHRWIEHGYAITDQPHDPDPAWLTLTAKAMRELKLPYEAGFPPKEDLKEEGHIFACNEVRFKLMRTKTYGKYVWWSERAIKANWEEGAAGLDYDQLPDAELYLVGVLQICVEVELTRKSDTRYDQILAGLTAHYPQVIYCVRGAGLYRVLMNACERLGDERKSQASVAIWTHCVAPGNVAHPSLRALSHIVGLAGKSRKCHFRHRVCCRSAILTLVCLT
jgi:hypothetical protein